MENLHDDFISHPLMPSSQSELGPGVCAVDVDGDGIDELFIGGSKGEGSLVSNTPKRLKVRLRLPSNCRGAET